MSASRRGSIARSSPFLSPRCSHITKGGRGLKSDQNRSPVEERDQPTVNGPFESGWATECYLFAEGGLQECESE